MICPGFVKTPLVEKQIPEQAEELGISEERVIKEIMLAETVDKEFTTIEDVADVALFLAAFKTNALTGQSICVSHGWHMSLEILVARASDTQFGQPAMKVTSRQEPSMSALGIFGLRRTKMAVWLLPKLGITLSG